MRNSIFSALNYVLLSFSAFVVASCSEELDVSNDFSYPDELVPPSDGFRVMPVGGNVDTSGICLFGFSSFNKSMLYQYYPDDVTDTRFHKGGYTTINGKDYKTVIIGHQRWTVRDYDLPVDAEGVDWSVDSLWSRFIFKVDWKDPKFRRVYYFPYKFAMTFTDYEPEEDDGVPDGFESTTGWRIPSEKDVTEMYHMAADCHVHNIIPDVDDYIIENLNLKRTDLYVLYSVYLPGTAPKPNEMNRSDTTHCVIYENFGLFWNSDKYAETFTFAGLGNDGDFWKCQSNRDTICAPIRFVQNIKPLDFDD